MQSLTFVLEASLLAPLVEFATSSSGHVEPRQGLALGWLGSVVAGLAVVFGTTERAQADPCSPGWHCSNEICKWDHHNRPKNALDKEWEHHPAKGCVVIDDACTCPP